MPSSSRRIWKTSALLAAYRTAISQEMVSRHASRKRAHDNGTLERNTNNVKNLADVKMFTKDDPREEYTDRDVRQL